MPVLTSLVLDKGWKRDKNGRFGPAVVLRFQNGADGSVQFDFAPTLEHLPMLQKVCESVLAVDDMNVRHLKELQGLQVKQERELRELSLKLGLKSDPYFKAIASESFKSGKEVGCKSQ